MKTLALKIDVDTWRGTREGVPQLVEILKRHQAGATFLFSLGPDHTGRAIKRVFRPGFLSKVSRTSVVEHYGIRTLLYGTLLPGPDIGRREAALLRSVRDDGFEVGIHTWDHIKWQDYVAGKDAAWTRAEMQKAVQRFTEIFGTPPRTHGAAGWQMNEAAYALQKEFGLDYASDGRGEYPFQPVDAQGRDLGVPQLPSTLPTLDELIGIDGWTADNVHEHLLAITAAPSTHGHVYTLHAELEGMKLLATFDRLLAGWKAQGYKLVSTAEQFAALDAANLPRCRVEMGEIPGRSGTLALQGAAISE
ncbi:4-deoxy-4-formamido-L-arabinose-phosphoundecaprenol deformylase [Neisseriaceae bacterium JH1-16]|nr:4-deoxy-4-formamido-L-arabinose-phosphoundecaprenol deformylase [Neisseriaceae bacterium JH1-16]